MKTIEGYSKEKYTNQAVLLAGGGAKPLSDFFTASGGSLTGSLTAPTLYSDYIEAGSLKINGSSIFVNTISGTIEQANNSYTARSYRTNSDDTYGHWTVTIPGITELYDGLMICIKLTKAYYQNGESYNTLNVNGLGPKVVWYAYNNRATSHYSTNAELRLTYRSTAGSYTISTATGEITSGTVCTDGWIIDSLYYSQDSTTMQLYYSRIIAGENGLMKYSLGMMDEKGKYQSFTKTSGTGTKTKNDVGFILGSNIYYFNMSSDLASGSICGHGVVRKQQALIDIRYTLNTAANSATVPGLYYNKPVFIVGTVGTDGLFYLDDTWWTQEVPSTDDGKIYIKIGEASYRDYDTNEARQYRVDFLSEGKAYRYKDGRLQVVSTDCLNALPLSGGIINGNLEVIGSATISTLSVLGTASFSTPIAGDLLGNASTADRLSSTTTIGSTATPVYFANGVPVVCSGTLGSVNLSQSTTSDYRPIIVGYLNASAKNATSLYGSCTNVVYTTNKLTMLPSTGNLYTAGSIEVASGGTITGNLNFVNTNSKIYGNSSSLLTISSTGGINLTATTSTNITVTASKMTPHADSNCSLGTSDCKWWKIFATTMESVNGVYQTSDIRKKNILNYLSLDKSYDFLNNCKGFDFEFKTNPGIELMGVSAQDIEKYFPEIVNTDSDGWKSVQYDKLSVILLGICKDMNDRLKMLEMKYGKA